MKEHRQSDRQGRAYPLLPPSTGPFDVPDNPPELRAIEQLVGMPNRPFAIDGIRPGVTGGFTVTGSSTDGGSGVASYSYPSLGSGWSGAGTYTFLIQQLGSNISYEFDMNVSAVPEPGTVGLLACAGGVACIRARRRSSPR